MKQGLDWEKGENNLQIELDKYLSDDELVGRLQSLFGKICRYQSYGARPLHDFWSKIPETDRYRQALYVYLPNDLYSVLFKNFESYTQDLRKTRQNEQTKYMMDKELKEKNKYKRNKEEYQKILLKCDNLCKPKDKWKTGRVMLALRKKFNFDSILKKMIKNEFKENKKFKYLKH